MLTPSTLALLGLSSGILSALCYVPYIAGILRRQVKPERASWLIWSVLTTIGFFSNLAIGATHSLWLPGIQGVGVIIVFLLSLWSGYGGLLRRDLIILAASVCILLIWYFTKQPLIALYLTVLIDALGGYLTIIKAYEAPHTETPVTWALSALAGFLAILSVGRLEPALLSYPSYIFLVNGAVVVAIVLGKRRREQPLSEVSESMIRQALAAQWGMTNVTHVSAVKKTTAGRMVFRIDVGKQAFALKVCAPSRRKDVVQKDILVLRCLERAAFPACVVRDTTNGEGYGTINGSYAYIYEWIEGKNPESTTDTFEKLGAITGRLHEMKEPYPYVSAFRPAQKIQKLLATARNTGVDQRYIDLLVSIRDMSQLPQGMIHTDIGPHNLLQRPNGELLVIDWEDAGLGPMVIDLGWELEQCLSDESVFDMEKAKAVLRGYEKYRKLTTEEKHYVYDAALFFAFLYWMEEQQEFGTRRIDWLAKHRNEFEKIIE